MSRSRLCRCGRQRRKGGRYCRSCHAAWNRTKRAQEREQLRELVAVAALAEAHLAAHVQEGGGSGGWIAHQLGVRLKDALEPYVPRETWRVSYTPVSR